MYRVRRWSVRRSRELEWTYGLLEKLLVASDPLLRLIGYQRLEPVVGFIERHLKGLLFDCQMCGSCVLSSTGMSCPMNCPKRLRNGPCGGVRLDGNCEVEPDMRCVWVEAAEGASRMRWGSGNIMLVQAPVNAQIQGSSSWLRAARHRDARAARIPQQAA